MTSPAIILDNGSGILKAGISTDMEPSVMLPTIISRKRQREEKQEISDNDITIPIDIKQRTDKNSILNYPIENGIVTNWDMMETIWQHTFSDQLKIKVDEFPMVLTEAPQNPKTNREKMAEIMFEKFSSPKLTVMTQGVLSLYGAGQLNGIVLEIGYGVTQIIPVIAGFEITNSIMRSDLAGNDLTEYLMKILSNSNEISFTTRIDKEIVQVIKEKYCFVRENDKILPESVATYVLPDQQTVNIQNEKYQSSEPLFDPSLLNINANGVHTLLNNSIQTCAVDLRKSLYSNIILAGGTAMTTGFNKRLENEMKKLAPEGTKIGVKNVRNKYMAWLGGAVLANQSSFQNMYITKQQYDENGPAILHKMSTK